MFVVQALCIRTLDNQIWSKNTHSANPDTRLGGSVCSAEAGEDNGRRATHRTKEWLITRCQYEDFVDDLEVE